MTNTDSTTVPTNGGTFTIPGHPITTIPSGVAWTTTAPEFRKSVNDIEGKTWYEMDVSQADIIVILQDGKRVEMDKKDFLQKVGLEW
jgi:hypothetical protein